MVRHFLLCASLVSIGVASAQQPSFEVASIKPNVSERTGGSAGPRGDSFTASNMPLKALLIYAYSSLNAPLLNSQIIGGPDWINDRFDIQAKAGGAISPEQARVMLQSLLEDRFQLKAHRDARELPVYNLVPARNGPKLSADQTPPNPSQTFIEFLSPGEPPKALPRGAMRMVTGPSSTTLTGTAVTVAQIVSLLQGGSDRIIIDKTGFSGLIDVQLEFSREAGPTDSAPLLFTAIQDIGLKLESAKAPLEVIVIDSVQKPSAN